MLLSFYLLGSGAEIGFLDLFIPQQGIFLKKECKRKKILNAFKESSSEKLSLTGKRNSINDPFLSFFCISTSDLVRRSHTPDKVFSHPIIYHSRSEPKYFSPDLLKDPFPPKA